MPFKSKKQQRWMFANEPEMAKRWAHETEDIKSLPESVGRDKDGKTKKKRRKSAASLSVNGVNGVATDPGTGKMAQGTHGQKPHQISANTYPLSKAATGFVPAPGVYGGNPGNLGNLQAMHQQMAGFDHSKTPLAQHYQMIGPAGLHGTAETLGSPVMSGKLGNGPGVGFSGAGTQQNFGEGGMGEKLGFSEYDMMNKDELRAAMPTDPAQLDAWHAAYDKIPDRHSLPRSPLPNTPEPDLSTTAEQIDVPPQQPPTMPTPQTDIAKQPTGGIGSRPPVQAPETPTTSTPLLPRATDQASVPAIGTQPADLPRTKMPQSPPATDLTAQAAQKPGWGAYLQEAMANPQNQMIAAGLGIPLTGYLAYQWLNSDDEEEGQEKQAVEVPDVDSLRPSQPLQHTYARAPRAPAPDFTKVKTRPAEIDATAQQWMGQKPVTPPSSIWNSMFNWGEVTRSADLARQQTARRYPTYSSQETPREHLSRWYHRIPGGMQTATDYAQRAQATNTGLNRSNWPKWKPEALDEASQVWWTGTPYDQQHGDIGAGGLALWGKLPADAGKKPIMMLSRQTGKTGETPPMHRQRQATLEHELTHQLLGPVSDMPAGDRARIRESVGKKYPQFDQDLPVVGSYLVYMARPEEVDVRLAEIKRQYAHHTGRLVNSPEEAKRAVTWWDSINRGIGPDYDQPGYEAEKNYQKPNTGDYHGGDITPDPTTGDREFRQYLDAVPDDIRQTYLKRMTELVQNSPQLSTQKQASGEGAAEAMRQAAIDGPFTGNAPAGPVPEFPQLPKIKTNQAYQNFLKNKPAGFGDSLKTLEARVHDGSRQSPRGQMANSIASQRNTKHDMSYGQTPVGQMMLQRRHPGATWHNSPKMLFGQMKVPAMAANEGGKQQAYITSDIGDYGPYSTSVRQMGRDSVINHELEHANQQQLPPPDMPDGPHVYAMKNHPAEWAELLYSLPSRAGGQPGMAKQKEWPGKAYRVATPASTDPKVHEYADRINQYAKERRNYLNNVSIAGHEIGPSIGDLVFRGEQFRQEEGKPLQHEATIGNKQHDINWMVDQAKQHGYFGGRSMHDLLLNTDAGKKWLEQAATGLGKQGSVLGTYQEAIKNWDPTAQTAATTGLLGAGIGGLAGLASAASGPDEDEDGEKPSYLGNMLTKGLMGAGLGGAIGAGGGALAQQAAYHSPKFLGSQFEQTVYPWLTDKQKYDALERKNVPVPHRMLNNWMTQLNKQGMIREDFTLQSSPSNEDTIQEPVTETTMPKNIYKLVGKPKDVRFRGFGGEKAKRGDQLLKAAKTR